jgi:ABC-type lipoprotein release transport system permease subunit
MAWRNIWRNRRRSLVTMAAMTLALVVTILYSGLVAGFLLGLERIVLDKQIGDMQIFAAGYRDDPNIFTRIERPEALLRRLEAAGYAAAPRLLAAGLIAGGETSAGARVIGLEVKRNATVSEIHRHVASGRWLDPADPRGVVLGKRLARTLDVKVGAELVALTQGADGSMANELYRVRGVLQTVGANIDSGGVLMTEGAFRELLVLPSGAHQIIVRKGDPKALLEPAAREVRALAAGLDVKTWRQLLPTIASYLDSTRGMISVMFLIIYIAIGIVILNAMLMAVFERIREFGVLKALGMKPGKVLRLILAESGLQTALATVVGTVLSLPGLWYLATHGMDTGSLGGATMAGVSFDAVWRARVDPQTFTQPISLLVIVVLLAVLYPAIKAALIKPIAAMQHR